MKLSERRFLFGTCVRDGQSQILPLATLRAEYV